MTITLAGAPPRPAGEVVTRFVDPANEASWDTKVSKLPGATFFHGAAWCRVLKETYGFHPCYVVAEQCDAPGGILPLMEVDNWPKGRRGISLPFTDECSLLGSGAAEQIMEAAMKEGRVRNWKYLELRGMSDGAARAQTSLCFYEHHLELQLNEKDVFGRFDAAVQRAARKAAKSGVTAEVSTGFDAVTTFYRLHCRTRRKHVLPPQPFAFFDSIHRCIISSGQGFVVVARAAGEAIAAAIFFHFGSKAIYKFGASDEQFQHLRGNNVAMWEAIRWLAGHGFTDLDFGRTSLDNDGLRRFKLGWGTSESRIEYAKYDFAAGRFVKDQDQTSGWHTYVFRLLPTRVSRRLGTVLYHRTA